jgi:hypothetical protein
LALFLDLGGDRIEYIQKLTLKKAASILYKGEDLKKAQDAIDVGDFSKLDEIEEEAIEEVEE